MVKELKRLVDATTYLQLDGCDLLVLDAVLDQLGQLGLEVANPLEVRVYAPPSIDRSYTI